MNLPRMSLHIGDYLKDTTHLDAALHGAYLMLIMHYWANGELPSDDRQLGRIARMTPAAWRRSRPIVQEFFYDGWKHKRVDEELAEAKARYERYADAGRKSGRVRAKKEHRSKDVRTSFEQPLTLTGKEVEVGDDARATPEKSNPLISADAVTLADELTRIVGHDLKFVPPEWCGAAMTVAKWLRQGWPREIIIVAVRTTMAKKRDGPPNSINYFEKPIAAEIARQAAPLPTVKVADAQEITIEGPNGTHRNGNEPRGRGTFATRALEHARAANANRTSDT